MMTPAQRQDYLIANPVQAFGDNAKAMAVMNAWLLSDLFRLNQWNGSIHDGVREKRLAEQTTAILNRSAPIVWG